MEKNYVRKKDAYVSFHGKPLAWLWNMNCKLNGAWHVWVAIKALAAALFFPSPNKHNLLNIQAASLLSLVASGGLLQSSGSAWPQVANHWVHVVWLQ